MSHATYLIGDVFDRMADLPDGSVDLIVTSPPFLALRSYLPADHPDKGKEIGSEPTPAAFIDTMLALSAEWRRLLAPHGSIAVELGDTYASRGGAVTDATGDVRVGGLNGRPTITAAPYIAKPGTKSRMQSGDGWPLAKSKTLIPELYRIALAYGIHPLTGQPSPAGTWRVRNVVTWCRPNPPVGALGDKWRPATSDVVIACVSPKRYWDDIATRKEHAPVSVARALRGRGDNAKDQMADPSSVMSSRQGHGQNSASGAPLLDYWEIPPGGYPGSHYAVYPPALIEPLIKAMAPPKICVECGEPARRIVETSYVRSDGGTSGVRRDLREPDGRTNGTGMVRKPKMDSRHETTGWTSCGHDNYRPALILDPFAGSGTTLLVATGHGHNAIGIDLDERNADLARQRIGELFLTVEEAA